MTKPITRRGYLSSISSEPGKPAGGLRHTQERSPDQQSIWQAIQELGATRIGHGVSALADPDLIQMMKEKRIGIECNLTSNVQTSTVPDYPSHPLRRFLENGLLATINTDDPGISAIDLAYEIQVAAPAAGLSPAQIEQAKANALEVSFLTENQKNAILTGAPFF